MNATIQFTTAYGKYVVMSRNFNDESHMNKYFIENKDLVHTLGPEYAYPEVFAGYCDFEPKIVHLAKDNSKYQK